MTRNVLLTFTLASALGLGFTASAKADIIGNTSSYDSPNGYDFVGTFPPAGSTTIGTYDFTIPAGDTVTGITISGTFGNGDSATTALSDYYLGFGGDETAVEVAACDQVTGDCFSNENGPTGWNATLTAPQIASLETGLTAGSLDFTYTWDNNAVFAFSGYDQYVYAGPASIDISYAAASTATPEPAAFLICFGGLAGVIAARRFRQV